MQIPPKQPINRKAFYNPIVTIYLLDDSVQQITALSYMKFNFKQKFEYDRTIDAGLKRLEKVFEEKKIYHIVLIKNNFTQKSGLEILQEIRQMEEKYQVPKQFVAAIDSDFTEEIKQEIIKQGFDDALTKLIDKRVLEGILQQRLEDE